MRYQFLNGQVAILVQYWEERYEENGEQVDGGPRIDVRRVEAVEGRAHRPGATGYRILPVGDGGIYRIDLSTKINSDVPVKRYHHHPDFRDGDVGPRVFDDELSADPIGWTEQTLRNLPDLLAGKGLPDLQESIDAEQLSRAMPLIMQSVQLSLHP